MEYIVVAFRSRTHTIKFYNFLGQNGISSEIVNTPKEAGVGCGLSVKLPISMVDIAKKGVKIIALPSFAGIFRVKNLAGKILIRSI